MATAEPTINMSIKCKDIICFKKVFFSSLMQVYNRVFFSKPNAGLYPDVSTFRKSLGDRILQFGKQYSSINKQYCSINKQYCSINKQYCSINKRYGSFK